MPTTRRKEFDAWWGGRRTAADGIEPIKSEVYAWEIWQAAAMLYTNTEGDCEEKLRKRDSALSTGYTSRIKHLEKEAEKWRLEASIRKEVHRDDYSRSAILLSALKIILRLSVEGSPIYEVANNALIETWGLSPTKHCDRHTSYRSTCEDCMRVGLSKARGHDVLFSEEEGNNSLSGSDS